jgi:hypothetical protein
MFAGTTTANQTINYQIIGWQKFATGNTGVCYVPRIIARGVATLGTAVLGTAGAAIESATALVADTITETTGFAGSLVYSPADNSCAWLEVDCSNCEYLTVDTDLGDAITTSVIFQLGDRAAGFMDLDVSVAGTGLATSAKQPTLGTGTMSGSAPVTLATDDTQFAKLLPLATANNPGAAVSITNTPSTVVLAANAARRSAIITNRSLTAMLTLSLGGTAVSGAGIPLAPAADATHPGGSVVIDKYTGAINGIMSVADATVGNVAVSEV